MTTKLNPHQARKKRHARVRAKISGTAEKPRLCVFRSLNHIYVQIIDDISGHTLVSASSKEIAELVGTMVAQRATGNGIKTVVFDRGGYQYHGRIQTLADAARKAGLEF